MHKSIEATENKMLKIEKNEFFYKDGSINTEKAVRAGRTARNDAIMSMFTLVANFTLSRRLGSSSLLTK